MPNIGDIYKHKINGATKYWLCSDVLKSDKGDYIYLGFTNNLQEDYPIRISKITIAKHSFYYSKKNCFEFSSLVDPLFRSNHLYRMDEFYHNIVDQCKAYDDYIKSREDDERISIGAVFRSMNPDKDDSFIIMRTIEDYYLCYSIGSDNYAQKMACEASKFHNMIIDDRIKYDKHLEPMEYLSYLQKFTTGIQFFAKEF